MWGGGGSQKVNLKERPELQTVYRHQHRQAEWAGREREDRESKLQLTAVQRPGREMVHFRGTLVRDNKSGFDPSSVCCGTLVI